MRHLKNQEKQPLWHTPQPKPTSSPHNNDPFICMHCHKTASTPVITVCSHISCWSCIRRRQQHQKNHLSCIVCGTQISLHQLRPIYISGQEHDHAHLTTRPKATNIEAIRNPGGFVARQTRVEYMANNIEIGKQVPSCSALPSNFMLVFSNFSQQIENTQNAEEKNVTSISIKLQKCLLISILLIVIGLLLLSARG